MKLVTKSESSSLRNDLLSLFNSLTLVIFLWVRSNNAMFLCTNFQESILTDYKWDFAYFFIIVSLLSLYLIVNSRCFNFVSWAESYRFWESSIIFAELRWIYLIILIGGTEIESNSSSIGMASNIYYLNLYISSFFHPSFARTIHTSNMRMSKALSEASISYLNTLWLGW